jgi:hypothetical protein
VTADRKPNGIAGNANHYGISIPKSMRFAAKYCLAVWFIAPYQTRTE